MIGIFGCIMHIRAGHSPNFFCAPLIRVLCSKVRLHKKFEVSSIIPSAWNKNRDFRNFRILYEISNFIIPKLKQSSVIGVSVMQLIYKSQNLYERRFADSYMHPRGPLIPIFPSKFSRTASSRFLKNCFITDKTAHSVPE